MDGHFSNPSEIIHKFHMTGSISRNDLGSLIQDIKYWKHKYKSEIGPVTEKNKEYRRLLKENNLL